MHASERPSRPNCLQALGAWNKAFYPHIALHFCKSTSFYCYTWENVLSNENSQDLPAIQVDRGNYMQGLAMAYVCIHEDIHIDIDKVIDY